MLIKLNLENFLVFSNLSVQFSKGLNIITGETGAGKSTILEALNILFGGRADTNYIRTGSDKAVMQLTLAHDNPYIQALLSENDIDYDNELCVRRVIYKNRPSKIYLNGVAITASLLAKISSYFVDVIGQFEDRNFLNPAGFRVMLDSLIIDKTIKQDVISAYQAFADIEKQIAQEKAAIANAIKEKDYLDYMVQEIGKLNPKTGEEDELMQIRSKLMAIEKNASILKNIEQSLVYVGDGGIEGIILNAIKQLSIIEGNFPEDISPIIEQLNASLESVSNAVQALTVFNHGLEFNPQQLSDAEERLFALRGAARKHHVAVDELEALYKNFQTRLDKINFGEANLERLNKLSQELLIDYQEKALKLREERLKIVPVLENQINSALTELNMKEAKFRIRLEEIDTPTTEGSDKILFELATGAGMSFGEIHKTASGGELSRFMLAAKSSVIEEYSCLIFDEIDRGVGGATAEAVGLKLLNLAQKVGQVIVITHSPQVATKGDVHFHIEKKTVGQETSSVMQCLSMQQRQQEIARMLAGAIITDEALAAAKKLLQF